MKKISKRMRRPEITMTVMSTQFETGVTITNSFPSPSLMQSDTEQLVFASTAEREATE
jgi:hypothetical protein